MEAKVTDYGSRGADKNKEVCKDCKFFLSRPTGYCKLNKRHQPRKSQESCWERR
jgi:hypothetical protein